jgi:hypothetical protein
MHVRTNSTCGSQEYSGCSTMNSSQGGGQLTPISRRFSLPSQDSPRYGSCYLLHRLHREHTDPDRSTIVASCDFSSNHSVTILLLLFEGRYLAAAVYRCLFCGNCIATDVYVTILNMNRDYPKIQFQLLLTITIIFTYNKYKLTSS